MDEYLFSDAWAKACQAEINASETYREAAATWEDPVAFTIEGDGGRGVFVDLWHGQCRDARVVSNGDVDRSPYVIAGDEATWENVLGGSLEPLNALVTGRLKLVKGNLGALAFHIRSARELVNCAARVQQRRTASA